MKRLLYIIICLALVLSASAKPSFRTSELERLAQALALDIDALPEGYSHPTANGLRLTVHQTDETIDHIGMYLFSEEMRQMGKSPIFDFLSCVRDGVSCSPVCGTRPSIALLQHDGEFVKCL